DPSARARLLGPALFLATAGDGDARNVNLWSAWCRFVSVQLGTSSTPSAQDERHRQERDRRHQTAQSLRADDRVAQGIERPRKGDRKQRDRNAASRALGL